MKLYYYLRYVKKLKITNIHVKNMNYISNSSKLTFTKFVLPKVLWIDSRNKH